MTRKEIAFGCYLVAIIIIASISPYYLFTPHLLPFHEQAIAVAWSDLTPAFQSLFLSLMKVAGGGYMTTTLSLLVLLFIPFKRGDNWARWAIIGIGIPAILIINYAGLNLILNTPARPPILWGPVVITLLIAGFIVSAKMEKGDIPQPVKN